MCVFFARCLREDAPVKTPKTHVVRPPPELDGDAAAHYDSDEAGRYDAANVGVQAELARRCFDLLGLPRAAPALLLDAGCGSCLYTAELRRIHPRAFVLGLDISRAMLERARDAGAARWGDLVLCDLARPLPLRRGGVFDGAFSVSALQWLSRAPPQSAEDHVPERALSGGNKRHAKRALERRRKLQSAGALAVHAAPLASAEEESKARSPTGEPLLACLSSLAARLLPGGRFALQVYPQGAAQAAECAAAVRATPGLAKGGFMADLPHRGAGAKRFIVGEALREGATEPPVLAAPPCPLSWPMDGGCALWWRGTAGVGATGDEWEAKLLRWHAREARSLARLLSLSPEAVDSLPHHKRRACEDELSKGRAKAAQYPTACGGGGCCAAWVQAWTTVGTQASSPLSL